MKTKSRPPVDFSESRTARDQWDEMGLRNELLPPECFRDEIAAPDEYYDDSSHWATPRRPRTGPDSPALQNVIDRCCQGWADTPTATELYDAFRANEPSDRQLALLRTWFIEATLNQILEAWAQQAYTDRQLVRAIHRTGHGKTDVPRIARRLRTINSWAE